MRHGSKWLSIAIVSSERILSFGNAVIEAFATIERNLVVTSIKDAPLPWTFVGNSWQYTTIYDATGEAICCLDLEDWGVNEENQYDLEQRQEMVANLIVQAVNRSGGLDGLAVTRPNRHAPGEE